MVMISELQPDGNPRGLCRGHIVTPLGRSGSFSQKPLEHSAVKQRALFLAEMQECKRKRLSKVEENHGSFPEPSRLPASLVLGARRTGSPMCGLFESWPFMSEAS